MLLFEHSYVVFIVFVVFILLMSVYTFVKCYKCCITCTFGVWGNAISIICVTTCCIVGFKIKFTLSLTLNESSERFWAVIKALTV